jgi:hypothetical protein
MAFMRRTRDNRRISAGGGFTLVELMVGMSLSFIMIAVTLAAYTFVGRNLTRMANMQALEATSRRAFYIFSKDVSTATQVSSASTSQLVLTLPTKTVTYNYASGVLTRFTSVVVSPEDVLTTDTTNVRANLLTRIDTSATTPFRFNYLNTSGTSITAVPSIKAIEFVFTSALTNNSDNLQKSSYAAVSPRVVLSNRPLLQ